VVDMDASSVPTWSSTLVAGGIEAYNQNGDLSEDFDLDWRDPAVDGGKAFAAGYMQLGHWTAQYGQFFQFNGVVHALELHTSTLSDRHTIDVVGALRTWMLPGTPPPPVCEDCTPGYADHDINPTTACEECQIGRYSNATRATACTSTCTTGATLSHAGSASDSGCTPCLAGAFGKVVNGTAVCSLCAPGTFSTTVGANDESACAACPLGRFSGTGWYHCQPSGCLDEWASNYDSEALVDSGECTYSCPNLWEKVSHGASHGGCLIFQGGTWERRAPNGSAIVGPIPDDSIADDQAMFREVVGETWIVQGHHLAGATREAPVYVELASNGAELYVAAPVSSDESRLTLRYVALQDHVEHHGHMYQTVVSKGDGAHLALDHVAIQRNIMTSGGITTGLGGGFTWESMACTDNVAVNPGGCFQFATGDGSGNTLRNSQLHRNSLSSAGAARGGGAIYMWSFTDLDVAFTEFVGNRATRGGAIYVSANAVLGLQQCFFAENTAQVVGGAIAAEMATIEIDSVLFVSNHASALGAALHIDQPQEVMVLNTTFDPFVDGALVVFIGGRLAGCDEHPCNPGHSCSYSKYSLACTVCPETQMSTDGLQCSRCAAGEQPNDNQTGCVPCEGNAFSTSGHCEVCVGTAVDENRQCLPCPLNQVADPPEDGCRCDNGYVYCLMISRTFDLLCRSATYRLILWH
jgi:predicted outer membrane repeat protein